METPCSDRDPCQEHTRALKWVSYFFFFLNKLPKSKSEYLLHENLANSKSTDYKERFQGKTTLNSEVPGWHLPRDLWWQSPHPCNTMNSNLRMKACLWWDIVHPHAIMVLTPLHWSWGPTEYFVSFIAEFPIFPHNFPPTLLLLPSLSQRHPAIPLFTIHLHLYVDTLTIIPVDKHK